MSEIFFEILYIGWDKRQKPWFSWYGEFEGNRRIHLFVTAAPLISSFNLPSKILIFATINGNLWSCTIFTIGSEKVFPSIDMINKTSFLTIFSLSIDF